MYKFLIACRAGVGSSLMLKIKTQQVIKENNFPIEVEHGSLDSLNGFDGDAVETVIDVAEELKKKNLKFDVIGIRNVIDRNEIKTALEQFLASKENKI
jgi:PTS system ascorbate-specific IIB component